MGTLHEDQYTFFIISPSALLRMNNISYKSSTENQNTHFISNNFFYFIFFFENHAVYEILCKHIVQPDRLQMTVQRMSIARSIPKATNRHS